MREAIKKNKKIIIIGIAIILILLIGLAFAYLRTTLQGEKEYLVRAGTLDLVLNEGNELTLEKQIPIEDSEGQSLNGFNFSLVNHGSIDTDYTIYLDDIALDEGETRMPDSAIRYSLTRNDEVFMTRNMTTMGSNPNRRVDFGTISPDETINYTLRIWIDYDATTEEASGKTFKGKLRVVATQPVGEEASTVLLDNIPKESQFDDGTDTFITGEDPNNYIWYSGKLWRAVSVNNEEKTVKLVTQWNISTIPYDDNSSAFEGSYMEDWLNDTSADGFLGNLRDYENFIVTDAVWDYTMNDRELGSITRPNGETTVTDTVGLLNMYEYQSTGSQSYLKNSVLWFTLTPNSLGQLHYIDYSTYNYDLTSSSFGIGIRPSLILKSDIRIVDGDGTENNPYRLEGDNDSNLLGTLLNTRYSGEYISFGIGENNLYRIVSHETEGLTKITSAEPLKDNGEFKKTTFGNDTIFSNTNDIGNFLNNDYLKSSNGYLTDKQINMIEESSTWYLGTVVDGASYKLAKYTDTTGNILTSNATAAKVGLLRLGELMSGQFNITSNNIHYWTLTQYRPYMVIVRHISSYGNSGIDYAIASSDLNGVRPSLNLKSNVIITGGDGTKQNPFTLELAS